MTLPDIINGGCEIVGACLTFSNILRVRRDRGYAGVNASVVGFFLGWGLWNCFYYPHLGQWASFFGGALMVTANILWIAAMRYYGPIHRERPLDTGSKLWEDSLPAVGNGTPCGVAQQ